MKVLFCGGSENAASWEMRARQIASTNPDWKAINSPGLDDIKAADIIVAVKRIKPGLAMILKGVRKPVVWDALDFWPQDKKTKLPSDPAGMIMLAVQAAAPFNPSAIIAANKKMAEDMRGLVPSVTYIYHHARTDAKLLKFAKIAYYDGAIKHAEKVLPEVETELRRHGWELRIGKPEEKGGALIGLRDQGLNWGIAARYKSNVKAANAIAYGLRFIARPESGYVETIGAIKSGSPIWVNAVHNVEAAIAQLCEENLYEDYSTAAIASVTLEYAAARYQEFFTSLLL